MIHITSMAASAESAVLEGVSDEVWITDSSHPIKHGSPAMPFVKGPLMIPRS